MKRKLRATQKKMIRIDPDDRVWILSMKKVKDNGVLETDSEVVKRLLNEIKNREKKVTIKFDGLLR